MDHHTGHIARRIGSQHHNNADKLRRKTRTLHGDTFTQILRAFGVIPGYLRQLRQNVAGGDGVGTDAELRPLNRHGTGQGCNRAFRRAVDRTAAEHADCVVRGNIDNVAVLMRNHFLDDLLRQEENALEVNIHNAVVRCLVIIEEPDPFINARAVNQYIELPIFRIQRICKPCKRGGIRHIKTIGLCLAALVTQLLRNELMPPEEETEDKPRRTLAEILGLNRKGDKDDVGMDV